MNKFETKQPGFVPESKSELRRFRGARPKTLLRLLFVAFWCVFAAVSVMLNVQTAPEDLTRRRELTRFPLTTGSQTFDPVEILPGYPAAEFEIEAVAASGKEFKVEYQYDLRGPWGTVFDEGASGEERRYETSLFKRLFSSEKRRARFNNVPIPNLGPLSIACNVESMEGVDQLWAVVYEARIHAPDREETPVITTPQGAFAALSGDPFERKEAMRFLRYQWWKSRDDREEAGRMLKALCEPEINAWEVYPKGAPVDVELKNLAWSALRRLGGPFLLTGGVEETGEGAFQKEFFSLRMDGKGYFSPRKNLADSLGEKPRPHNLRAYWNLERYNPDPLRAREVLWNVEWTGEPIEIAVATEFPEGVPRPVSTPEIDRKMAASFRFELESVAFHTKDRSMRCVLTFTRPLPMPLAHQICVILGDAAPFPIGNVVAQKGEQETITTPFIVRDLKQGRYEYRFVLRPALEKKQLNILGKKKAKTFWGGSHESKEKSWEYVPRSAE